VSELVASATGTDDDTAAGDGAGALVRSAAVPAVSAGSLSSVLVVKLGDGSGFGR
jgi:hypothetical protein